MYLGPSSSTGGDSAGNSSSKVATKSYYDSPHLALQSCLQRFPVSSPGVHASTLTRQTRGEKSSRKRQQEMSENKGQGGGEENGGVSSSAMVEFELGVEYSPFAALAEYLKSVQPFPTKQ